MSRTPPQVTAVRCFTWNSRRPERFPTPTGHALARTEVAVASRAHRCCCMPLATQNVVSATLDHPAWSRRLASTLLPRVPTCARRVLLRTDRKRAASDVASSAPHRPVSVRTSTPAVVGIRSSMFHVKQSCSSCTNRGSTEARHETRQAGGGPPGSQAARLAKDSRGSAAPARSDGWGLAGDPLALDGNECAREELAKAAAVTVCFT